MLARVGPRQGKRRQVCSRIGRQPRTPSDIAEMKEEKQMEVGRARIWGKQKVMQSNVLICFWSIGYLDQPWPFIFIGWDGLTPQEISFTYLNLQKSLIVLGLLSDRSGSCLTGYSTRPVRPLGQTSYGQFWLSTYAPLFFGKACLPKNNLLDQNCPRAMVNNTSSIHLC